jgi:ATP/ADP translocase
VTERQTAALQQATKETLYVPLIDVQKYKAKAVIDMFIDRLGKAISAIALILATSVAGLSIRVLLTIAAVAILVWIWSADGLGRRYAVRAADRVDDAA